MFYTGSGSRERGLKQRIGLATSADLIHWQAGPPLSALGPFDLSRAVRITDESVYSGRLIRDRAGQWVMLAFRNLGPDGNFVGELTDPMPVSWAPGGTGMTIDLGSPVIHRRARRERLIFPERTTGTVTGYLRLVATWPAAAGQRYAAGWTSRPASCGTASAYRRGPGCQRPRLLSGYGRRHTKVSLWRSSPMAARWRRRRSGRQTTRGSIEEGWGYETAEDVAVGGCGGCHGGNTYCAQ